MSQVAHHPPRSVAVRFRSHRNLWLALFLVLAAGVTALVITSVNGSDSSSSDTVVPAQPFTSAPHPDEGGAPIRLGSSGTSGAYDARPQEGSAPIDRGGVSSTYTDRPQEGSAPIQLGSDGSAYEQRPQEGQAPIRP